MRRRYRFGFILTTGAGNRTRYENLRRFADEDPDIECVWAPDPSPGGNGAGWLGTARRRAAALRFAEPVLRRIGELDAVLFHVFEPYVLAALRSVFARRPLLFQNDDAGPSTDPEFWRGYGLIGRTRSRARLRFALDEWCASRVALFFPWSRWAGAALGAAGVGAERIHVIHVGVDLEKWPQVRRGEDAASERPKILFVGGDFDRKGGPLLLDVFRRRFAGRAELHLVTRSAPPELPPGVFVHDDLVPNDPRLRALYAEADLFVLPTWADMSSFAALEAMATGLPVVATAVGGITELVRDGETGYLVPAGDAAALEDRIGRLLGDPALRRRFGEAARGVAEREYDAGVNVPRLLTLMKTAVDAA